ncbi:hypothetical protein BO94DRAFT_529568 [Aspergillus sclerotioniger CBS 115572]|uniref:2EXR domain-containing protein n=1 Tax=Aspergillus sclerotioniger CBS 115572 TaxID=1450535 RepID=A0A317XER4_9EURO|nr:hypothetical protein BO94DRAFT_529568 [Aspergillus sclerotioniger CBS 115572]PWY96167.1 hypothetical protein BO94DRAFT_529568 [Aspergillus sclerotioniger CBS 115572]
MSTPPSPYTYTDEQWKVHTIHPRRFYSRRKEDGILRPTRAAPYISIGNPSIGPRTAGEKAAEADTALWASCDSVEEYEAKRRDLDAAKAKAMANQPTFHPFPRLPTELRCKIWEMAMEEPTQITITCSGYTPAQRPTGWCRTVGSGRPRIYATTAFMPPLMLVNRETYALASKHYRRAFRGVNGGGGVLAAYPSVLVIERPMVLLLPMDDLELLAEIVVIATPSHGMVGFSTGFSDRLKTMLGTGSIRRVELRLTRSITRKQAGKVDGYFTSLFSEMRAVNAEWVAPELTVGPVNEEEDPVKDSDESSDEPSSDDD